MRRRSQLNGMHGGVVARGRGLHCGGGGGLQLLLGLGGWSFVRLLGGQWWNRRGGVCEGVSCRGSGAGSSERWRLTT